MSILHIPKCKPTELDSLQIQNKIHVTKYNKNYMNDEMQKRNPGVTVEGNL